MAQHIRLRPGGVFIPAALCGLCQQPARGLASIDDVPYCHEGKSPTCYERASATTTQGVQE